MRLFFVITILFSGCAAKPYPHLHSHRRLCATERIRLQLVIESMILPDQAPWQITLLENDAWWSKLKYYSRGQAREAEGSGFTVPEWHHTYLNAQWIRSASDWDIARVLAHEWGHIVCSPRCDDEEKAADDAGRHILRLIQ